MDELINKISNFIEKQEKVYLSPGEEPPKGTMVGRGPKGGRYYETTPKVRIKPEVRSEIVRQYNLLTREKKVSHDEAIKKISHSLKTPLEDIKYVLPEKPKKGYMYPEWDKIWRPTKK